MTTEPNPTHDTDSGNAEQPVEMPAVAEAGGEETAAVATANTEPAPAAPATVRVLPSWMNLDGIFVCLLLVLSFFLASFAATNSDLWMQLAIGKRLSEGQFEFGVDSFSWATQPTATNPAPFWVHHGWLSSWLFYQTFPIANGNALVLSKAILFTLAMIVLIAIGWNQTNRWVLFVCLTTAALAISPRLTLHPVVISFLFLAITLLVLSRAGLFGFASAEQPVGARCLWCLPPLFALWANLDSWFILGPLALGLCWAATGLAKLLRGKNPVPGSTIGLVFVVSLLACLLNPHHVRVFQLPPELAYIVLMLKLPIPDALTGGGRTLQLLHQANPALDVTSSSFSAVYWKDAWANVNIAGIAFYPLLVVGVFLFALPAFMKQLPGAPAFHFGRFLLWAAFAIMAVAMHRMIAFFAIVAAPLTALMISEFLVWQQRQAEGTASEAERSLRWARFASLPCMLLLLCFAWPGWLHGSNEYNAPRRVAWDVRPDSSLQQAAETLRALKARNTCGNVFNVSFEFPNYCAWFAPEVKCYLDSRFALFPDRVAAFTRAQKALDDPNQPAADWQPLFTAHHVDQVVLANFASEPKDMPPGAPKVLERFLSPEAWNPAPWNQGNPLGFLARYLPLHWWGDADQWRQRFGDNRTMVFSWSGPDRTWPANTARNDWNRAAFGEIPTIRDSLLQPTIRPQDLDSWELYKHGSGTQPHKAMEAQLLGLRYLAEHQLMLQTSPCIWPIALADTQILPGIGMNLPASLICFWCVTVKTRPLDFGPPALPILMVRSARLAVAQNPYDGASQTAHLEAFELLRRKQEDFWTGTDRVPASSHPSQLRDRIRQLQRITTLYNLTQLQPDQVENHERLAYEFAQAMLFDLSVDHMHMAEKAWESRKNVMKNRTKDFDDKIRDFQDEVRQAERRVQLRLAKLKERAGMGNRLDLAVFALRGPYKEEVGERVLDAPLGLAKSAFAILQSIQEETLSQRDRTQYLQLQLELLLATGRGGTVAHLLQQDDVRKSIDPFTLAQLDIMFGAVTGDYDGMDRGLQVLESAFEEQAKFAACLWFNSSFQFPTMQSAGALCTSLTLRSNAGQGQYFGLYNFLFNVRTLRGTIWLEAGDTKRARDSLTDTLGKVHPPFGFTDQPIAKRYLDLLNPQK